MKTRLYSQSEELSGSVYSFNFCLRTGSLAVCIQFVRPYSICVCVCVCVCVYSICACLFQFTFMYSILRSCFSFCVRVFHFVFVYFNLCACLQLWATVNVSIIIVKYCKMQSARKSILTTFSSDLRFALSVNPRILGGRNVGLSSN
jgi:hypothetical protein